MIFINKINNPKEKERGKKQNWNVKNLLEDENK